MADRVRVNTSSLSRTRESVSSQVNKIRTQITALYQDVDQLNGMWEGDAHAVFDAKFKADIRYLESLMKSLDGIVSFETNAEKEYNTCESKVGSLISDIQI